MCRIDALAQQLAQAIAQRRKEPDGQKLGQRVAEWQSAWDEILRTTIPKKKVRLRETYNGPKRGMSEELTKAIGERDKLRSHVKWKEASAEQKKQYQLLQTRVQERFEAERHKRITREREKDGGKQGCAK